MSLVAGGMLHILERVYPIKRKEGRVLYWRDCGSMEEIGKGNGEKVA